LPDRLLKANFSAPSFKKNFFNPDKPPPLPKPPPKPPPNLNNAAPIAALPNGDLAIFLTPRVTFLTNLPKKYICLPDSRSMIPPSGVSSIIPPSIIPARPPSASPEKSNIDPPILGLKP